MPVTKIQTEWLGGDLSWQGVSGTSIARWNSTKVALEVLEKDGLDLTARRDLVKVPIDTENSSDPSIAQTMLLTAPAAGTSGALGATHTVRSIVPSRAVRVMDVVVRQTATGSAGDKMRLASSAADMTDTMTPTGASGNIVRAGSIVDAQHVISSSETIKITVTAGTTSKKTATADVLLTVVRAS